MRTAYKVILRREPDEAELDKYVDGLRLFRLNAWDIVDHLRTFDEYRNRTPVGAPSLLQSLHISRCEFIIGLPPAKRIIDLGGSHTNDPRGGLVLLGYPYDCDDLVIVDLPPEDRHDLYKSRAWTSTPTPRGPVRYEFRSMTDLSFAADGSVDLVYSGQSIEHVTPDDAKRVFAEVHRVLTPGGWFALDTPNGPVCRLQSPELIDPDHEVEYSLPELVGALEDAGFGVVERKGLNLAASSVATNEFRPGDVAAAWGVFADGESCYLLALVARKPCH